MMNSRRILLILGLSFLCLALNLQSAQGQKPANAFDQHMSLEETMVWLGKQLTLQRTIVSMDGKSPWNHGTRIIKAKGCTLSYWSTTETDGLEPASVGYVRRELWTLNLAGLDPSRITGHPVGRVWFWASGDVHNAIRTSMFSPDDRPRTMVGNRPMGNFWVRDEMDAKAVAAALSHAVELCRKGKT